MMWPRLMVLLLTTTCSGGEMLADTAVQQAFGLVPADARSVPQTTVDPSDPISIGLTVGRERRVSFPAAVEVGAPHDTGDSLQIQNIDRQVFLRATASIDHIRLVVRRLDGARTYILDLHTTTDDVSSASVVVDPLQKVAVRPTNTRRSQKRRIGLAARGNLRGPYQLIETLLRQAVEMQRGDTGNATGQSFDALVRGDSVRAQIVGMFRRDGLVVTTLQVRNRTRRHVALDPKALRGHWIAAAYSTPKLLGKGSAGDTALLYLISTEPVEKALGVFAR